MGNNQYLNKEQNLNNNINENFQNHSDIYKNPQDINYNSNYNIQNENDIIDMNNEEMKDNQTEDVEENEIYFEGQQFPHPEGFGDANNYNLGNSENNQFNQEYENINNEQIDEENENYNGEEEYKEEPEADDYKNLYQFQEIIEEEENENNTVEESNKNKSIKNSNINSNKSNFNNNINNNLDMDNENNFRMAKSQIEQMKNVNDLGGDLNDNLLNKYYNAKK